MPARTLAAAQRRNLERRVALLASTVASLDAAADAAVLAEMLEDVGNRFLDLSDWLTIADPASIHLDDAGVVGGGRGAI